MYIFLDDMRVPSDVTWVELPTGVEWKVVRNFKEFAALLDSLEEPPTFIAFDHDLADNHYPPHNDFSGEKTGYECAKYLVEVMLCNDWKEVPPYAVHSMNIIGKQRIHKYLEWIKTKL
jgi:hypothetical protein